SSAGTPRAAATRARFQTARKRIIRDRDRRLVLRNKAHEEQKEIAPCCRRERQAARRYARALLKAFLNRSRPSACGDAVVGHLDGVANIDHARDAKAQQRRQVVAPATVMQERRIRRGGLFLSTVEAEVFSEVAEGL